MDLAGFKRIYWWEWSHRLLGRAVGLVWALGFLFFWTTRRIPPGWTPRLLTLGVLGGLQGAVGWWMVASGLVEGMTSVASYRLAVHLGLAFAILGLRALYFALAAMIHRFEHLKVALSVVLIFIGSKVFAAELMGIGKIPPAISLGVTFAILASGILYSLWKTRGEAGSVGPRTDRAGG